MRACNQFTAIICLLATFATVVRAEIQFTTIATSHATDGRGLSVPSINNLGTVAFIDTSVPTATLYTGNGGSLTPIVTSADYFGYYSAGGGGVPVGNAAPAINDAGAVAFWSHFQPLGEVVFSATSSTLTPILSGAVPVGPPGTSQFSEDPQIANDGTVVLLAGNEGGVPGRGVFAGSGGSLTTFASSTDNSATSAVDPAISHQGTIAYAWTSGGVQELFTIHNSATTLVALTPLGSAAFQTIAVNDAGTVIASTGGSLEVGTSGSFLTIPRPSPFIDTFGAVSINDSNTFAFEGLVTSMGTAAIYSGTVGDMRTVIATGDSLDGSIVINLNMSREAINDRGQITFWAKLANGEQGIFVASPEPSSAVLLAIGCGLTIAIGFARCRTF